VNKVLKSMILFGVLFLVSGVLAQHRARPAQSKRPENNSKTQKERTNARWLSPDCEEIRHFFEKGYPGDIGKGVGAEVYSSYTRQKALEARQRLIDSPDWDNLLPCCPETERTAIRSPLFTTDSWLWELTLGRHVVLACFHPGAQSDFRTSGLYHRFTGLNAGQQCTYDKNGTLIAPDLPGAGTPDSISPTISADNIGVFFNEHMFFDVFPWTKLTLAEYNSVWKPDPGCNKPRPRPLDLDPAMINPALLWVERGDVISITATGKIKFDVEGNESGPEGSLVMPKTEAGILGRLFVPTPFPTAPAGALLGGVYTGELKSLPQFMEVAGPNLFYIGKGGDFKMPDNGYLVFLVNDGYLPNNTGSFLISWYRKVAR
jgi:hypothetical protein